jgi:hypothetical protein
MANSLFELICPACGAEMDAVAAGEASCSVCGTAYLVRLGHLLPIPRPRGLQPSAAASDEGAR